MMAVLVGVLLCIGVPAAGTLLLRARDRRRAAARVGENFATFCASFHGSPVPPPVMQSVYTVLQEWMSDAVEGFPVRAADDLHLVYGLVREDLDEAVERMLASCGRQWPSEPWPGPPVRTVSDLVCFVASGPVSEAVRGAA